jgi:hypothetical protein
MPLAMLTTPAFSVAQISHVGDVVGGLVLVAAGLLSYGPVVALVTGQCLRWVLSRPAGEAEGGPQGRSLRTAMT